MPTYEHRGGVHYVLARGPFVDVAGCVLRYLRDCTGERVDERWHGVALGVSFASYLLGNKSVRVAAGDDGLCRLARDQTNPRLRNHQSTLSFEHRPDPGSSRDGFRKPLRDEYRPEQLLGHL